MRILVLSIITLLSLSLVQGRLLWGKCPQVAIKSSLDPDQYDGLWYEIRRDAKTSFQKGGTCTTAEYTYNAGDNSLTVLNSQTKKGKRDSITGKAKCTGAQCWVRFKWYQPKGDYRVLDTDYTNYSIVYSCTGFLGIFKTEFLWILGRTTGHDPSSQLTAISSSIPSFDLNRLYTTPQGGSCVY